MADEQAEVIAFLKSSAGHPGNGTIRVVETHGALVFLAGDVALKIKRAVKYDYMDLSTLALREAMLRRELELNRPVAPKIYHDVVPVTRQPDGRLRLAGTGPVVEWALRMWRFPETDELSVIADQGGFSDELAADLGSAVHVYHQGMSQRKLDGAELIRDILDELDRVFAGMPQALGPERIATFAAKTRASLNAVGPLLSSRGLAGHVRRCHGDLHLRNLVRIDGKPVPFDALEFDERLGTCDVLYDLAFLIMDLGHRNLSRSANIVLNTYLLKAGGAEDEGLAAFPLFLALRAAIRAMVTGQTDTARAETRTSDAEAQDFLSGAIAGLAAKGARLVAVGGVSGSGKTTLGRELAPFIGAAPGAVHLGSDLERKSMAGVSAQRHLSPVHYAQSARNRVYQRMLQRAETILRAGHSALIDATFLEPEARRSAAELAAKVGVPFDGLWLQAPLEQLIARVTARIGDASDADESVVRAQIGKVDGLIEWTHLDASRPLGAVIESARAVLQGH